MEQFKLQTSVRSSPKATSTVIVSTSSGEFEGRVSRTTNDDRAEDNDKTITPKGNNRDVFLLR
jgi:hypothetical protein